MEASANRDDTMTCAGCGATVYQEHLDRGLAARLSGDVYCPHCVQEKHKADSAMGSDEKLTLVEGQNRQPVDRSGQSGVHTPASLSDSILSGQCHFQRPLTPTGHGATRVRLFHSKMSDAAIGHMENQINNWLDGNPEIEVKHVTTTVGTWEGKHPDPNLIIAIFY